MSDIEAPADPRGTFGYRAARLAVIVLSALIILALIGLVVGGIAKLSGHRTPAPAATTAAAAFVLPAGAQILSTDSQPGRIILHVRSRQGDEIDILSTDDGHLIAQVKASSPSP